MTNPKTPQIRAYLRSFNYTDDGMAEVEDIRGAVETGDYVRTSDYLLVRSTMEAELDRLRTALVVAQRHMHEREFPVDHYVRSTVDEALGGSPSIVRTAVEPPADPLRENLIAALAAADAEKHDEERWAEFSRVFVRAHLNRTCKRCGGTGSVQDSEVPYLGNPCPECQP
jgi:hypothetical protein